MNGTTAEAGNGSCAHHDQYDPSRFVLIFWAAGAIAFFGLVGNCGLVAAFGSASRRGTEPSFYLRVLATHDAAICACYILIFCGDSAGLYLQLEWVYWIWVHYAIPAFFVSKVVQLSSAYIIIAATGERLLLIAQHRPMLKRLHGKLSRRKARYAVVSTIFLVSVVLRGSVLFELTVDKFVGCPSNRTQDVMAVGVSALKNVYFYFIYDFYIMFFVQVLIPFIIIIALNLVIVRSLRQSYVESLVMRSRSQFSSFTCSERSAQNSARRPSFSPIEEPPPQQQLLGTSFIASTVYLQQMREIRERRERRAQAASATYTFVSITASYLVCNSVAMLITILERLPDQPFLMEADGVVPSSFYVIMTDIISFLFMLTAFLRLLINLVFSKEVRSNIAAAVRRPSAFK